MTSGGGIRARILEPISAGRTADTSASPLPGASTRGRLSWWAAGLAASLLACGPDKAIPRADLGEQSQAQSILKQSKPADGASATGPVEQIELWFSKPVRLFELTVSGDDGLAMPTMVTSAGPVEHYSVPVSILTQGTYSVRWRATAGERSHEGSFSFTVK